VISDSRGTNSKPRQILNGDGEATLWGASMNIQAGRLKAKLSIQRLLNLLLEIMPKPDGLLELSLPKLSGGN
jgi:hypothetical protein